MSKLWALEVRDFIRGLIMFTGAGLLEFLIQVVQNGSMTNVNLKMILNVAIVAALTYLLKNFSTDQNKKFIGKYEI